MILTTAREREVLLRLGLFRSLNTFQLERFLLPESGVTIELKRVVTKRILASLRKRGLVVQSAYLVGGPCGRSARLVYHLTDAGQRAAAAVDPTLSLRQRRRPSSLFLERTLMCAEGTLAHASCTHPGHELSEWRADWQIPELHEQAKSARCPLASGFVNFRPPPGHATVVDFAGLFVRSLERDETHDEPNLENSRPRAGRRV